MAHEEVPRNLSLSRKLDNFLRDYQAGPFDWKTHNCGHLASSWVLYATGREVSLGYENPETANARTVYRAVRRAAGDLPGLISQQLGSAPKGAAFARAGDILLRPTGEQRGALGICAGLKSAYLGPDGTIIYLPTLDGTMAWRLTL